MDRGIFLLLFKLLTQPTILKKAHYLSRPPSSATAFRDDAPSLACKPAWEKGRAGGRWQVAKNIPTFQKAGPPQCAPSHQMCRQLRMAKRIPAAKAKGIARNTVRNL